MKTLEGSGFPCLFSHFRKPTIKRITSGGDCFITESQDLDTQLPPMLKIVGRREMRKGWGRKGGGLFLMSWRYDSTAFRAHPTMSQE